MCQVDLIFSTKIKVVKHERIDFKTLLESHKNAIKYTISLLKFTLLLQIEKLSRRQIYSMIHRETYRKIIHS